MYFRNYQPPLVPRSRATASHQATRSAMRAGSAWGLEERSRRLAELLQERTALGRAERPLSGARCAPEGIPSLPGEASPICHRRHAGRLAVAAGPEQGQIAARSSSVMPEAALKAVLASQREPGCPYRRPNLGRRSYVQAECDSKAPRWLRWTPQSCARWHSARLRSDCCDWSTTRHSCCTR